MRPEPCSPSRDTLRAPAQPCSPQLPFPQKAELKPAREQQIHQQPLCPKPPGHALHQQQIPTALTLHRAFTCMRETFDFSVLVFGRENPTTPPAAGKALPLLQFHPRAPRGLGSTGWCVSSSAALLKALTPSPESWRPSTTHTHSPKAKQHHFQLLPLHQQGFLSFPLVAHREPWI